MTNPDPNVAASSLPPRSQYLTPRHGALNVGLILYAHALLVLWFAAAGMWLPWMLYLPFSVLACVIHQRAMSEWLHEGSHHNLVPDRDWNDRLTNALVSVWFGVTVAKYRSTHFPHHTAANFFQDGDPDTDFLAISSRADFWKGAVRDLLGGAVFRQFGRFDADATAEPSKSFLPVVAAVQFLLLSALFWFGRLEAYVLYYGTLCTLYPLYNRLRVYGQHLSVTGQNKGGNATGGTSRTIDAGWLDRILWASPRLLYHHEHHRYPALPYRALVGLCAKSDDRDVYSARRWDVLRDIYRTLPDA